MTLKDKVNAKLNGTYTYTGEDSDLKKKVSRKIDLSQYTTKNVDQYVKQLQARSAGIGGAGTPLYEAARAATPAGAQLETANMPQIRTKTAELSRLTPTDTTAESRLAAKRFDATRPSERLEQEAASQRAEAQALGDSMTGWEKFTTPLSELEGTKQQIRSMKEQADQSESKAVESRLAEDRVRADSALGDAVDLDEALDHYNLLKNTVQLNYSADVGRELLDLEKLLLSTGISEEGLRELAIRRKMEQNAQTSEALAEKTAQNAQEHPVLYSLASVPANLASGIGIGDLALQKLLNSIEGSDRPLDFNSGAQGLGQASSAIRETVASDMGAVGSFLYQTGMSMLDSAGVALLSMVGMPAAGALLGGSAATQAAQEAKARGLSDDKALLFGLASGAAEMIFESVSLERLKALQPAELTGAVKQQLMTLLKNTAKQSFTEGSEEFFTTVANTISDAIISGDLSDYNLSVQKYMEDGKSREEAEQLATKDWWKSAGLDFLGGAISGGVMGGVTTGIKTGVDAIRIRSQGTQTQNTQVQADQTQDTQTQDTAQVQQNAENAAEVQRQQSNTERVARQWTQEDAERRAQEAVASGRDVAYNQGTTQNEGVRADGRGEAVYLRGGSERADSQNPGGQVRRVEENAGFDQSGDVQARPADAGAASLTYEKQKVSTRALGIENGSQTSTLYRVIGGDTEATRAAKALAEENGVNLVLFGGGNLRAKNKNGVYFEARGMYDGKTIYVRADHAQYTAEQIMRHELGHKWIADGEVNVDAVRAKVNEEFTPEVIDYLSGLYLDAYADTELTASEVWEEVICDALGAMNLFKGFAEEADAAVFLFVNARTARSVRSETLASRAQSRTVSRNTGQKASREYSRRAQRGRSIEQETMENNRFARLRQFGDDLPAEWYAFTGNYFYLYSNQSYMDYTVLVKARINESNRADISNFVEELKNGTIQYSEAFNNWTSYFRRGNGRYSWDSVHIGSRGATMQAHGVDERARGSKHSANSEKDSRDRNRVKASRELDQSYLSAVERGDTETAQKLVDEVADAAGYRIHAYHGTARGDRVGNVFLPERATSGPMAFFTDSREIAEHYAKDKADTSLAYDEEYGDYYSRFRVDRNGKSVKVQDLWRTMPVAEKQRVKEAGKHITWDEDMENIVWNDDAEYGLGNWDAYTLNQHRGNAIEALIDSWLESGELWQREGDFTQVLKLAGIDNVEYRDPDARHEKVYDTYLKILDPFDTATVDEAFADGFAEWYEQQPDGKYDRDSSAADLWDKNGQTAESFLERLRDDIENGTSYSWTSIPDSVTDYLKSLGHDGIRDNGGKNGGESHTVWIPFSSEQVKSSDAVVYDDDGKVIPLSERFDETNRDIRYSRELDSTGRKLTAGQQEYFKDSKVRDEEGRLLTVYHGTGADFTVFDRGRIGQNFGSMADLGFYFTPYIDDARGYAGKSGTAMEAYLNLENPLIVEGDGWGSAAGQADIRHGDLRRWAEEGGHDGIIVKSTDVEMDENGTADAVYIAFSPEQIKSVTNQNPTSDADIRFSRELDRRNASPGEQVAWAVNNGIITEQERVAFFHTIANIKKLGYKAHRTSDGGYIVDLGNKLLFTDGDWQNPSLSSVWALDDTSEESMKIAKDVIFNGKHNKAGYEKSRQIIEDAYWAGYVERYTEQNSSAYAGENTGGEGKDRSADYEGAQYRVDDTYSPDYEYWRNEVKEPETSRELSIEQLREENDTLQQTVENLSATDGTMREQDAEKTARKLIREYDGTISADEIAEDVQELGNMLLRGESWENVKAAAMDISRGIVDSALAESEGYAETAELYREIKQTLRSTKILISREAANDIPDYNSWRKRYFGRLNLKITDGNTGVSGADAVYERLAGKYPGVFREGALAESDAILEIARALDSMRPVMVNPHSYYMTEATEYCANELIASLLPSVPQRLEQTITNGRERTQYALEQLRNAYGTIAPGENPAREVRMPKKTSEREKLSQTVRTVLEAEVTPEGLVPTIEDAVVDGTFSYTPYSDEAAIADADKTIRKNGFAKTLEKWNKDAKKGIISKKNTALGWALYNQMANSGDASGALDILRTISQQQRNAAQATQATRILKKLSPETQLYEITRTVDDMQEELNEKYRDKAPNLKIDEELAADFLNAETDEARDEASEKLFRSIGQQMPSRFMDRWNAWRYLSMLCNPRTHIRNIVGNAAFAPVVAVKNLTATAIESAVYHVSGGQMERTKRLIGTSKADRALLKAGWSDYAGVADEVSNGRKYSDSALKNSQIEAGRRIFGNTRFEAWNKTGGKALEATRKGNSYALEIEDVWFSKPHYAYAFAMYCKAAGITAQQITNGTANEENLAKAWAYAVKEAQKATYHDSNAISDTLSGLGKNSGKVVGTLMEGVLPFRKTPANILSRGLEYSPLGLIKGIANATYGVKTGKYTAAQAIDNISAGLTGTGLLGLGVWLAAEGLIRGLGAGDDDEREFEELQGHQNYALEIGGKSYTLDWLAPEALPFFVGVNLWEQATQENDGVTFSDILEAAKTISDPLLEMSCLQSLNDVIDSVGYASSEGLGALPSTLASAATSYLTQALPTLLGQFERTTQAERMTTYTEKNAFLTGDMQYTLGKASARIPGWDYNQIPYIDAWGRTESDSSALSRGLDNFLNPAYTSQIVGGEMEEELERLYGETSDSGVFPSRAAKYFNVDGDRVDLTAEQYVTYATEKGQKSYELVTELVGTEMYQQADDTDKAELVGMVYEYANALAKTSVSSYELTGWHEKAHELEKSGVDLMTYLKFRTTADADGNGSISQDEATATIKKLGLPKAAKAKLWQSFNTNWKEKNNPFR